MDTFKEFYTLCEQGSLKLVKKMYEATNLSNMDYNQAFIHAIVGGKLPTARWIYSLGKIDIHYDNDLFFSLATECNRFLTAKWIYSLGGVKIINRNEVSFTDACYNGNLEMAKWINSIYTTNNIKPNYFDLIHSALLGDQNQIIEWLFSLDGFPDIETIVSYYNSNKRFIWVSQKFNDYLHKNSVSIISN